MVENSIQYSDKFERNIFCRCLLTIGKATKIHNTALIKIYLNLIPFQWFKGFILIIYLLSYYHYIYSQGDVKFCSLVQIENENNTQRVV